MGAVGSMIDLIWLQRRWRLCVSWGRGAFRVDHRIEFVHFGGGILELDNM